MIESPICLPTILTSPHASPCWVLGESDTGLNNINGNPVTQATLHKGSGDGGRQETGGTIVPHMWISFHVINRMFVLCDLCINLFLCKYGYVCVSVCVEYSPVCIDVGSVSVGGVSD
eukprot:GHVR01133769.1.p1 GENE.GHVR01133769.1~~GHVR01133769.1.p1  ORF type:complete len:117 (+),score=38.01 GHVR01133769.1:214-564(+)